MKYVKIIFGPTLHFFHLSRKIDVEDLKTVLENSFNMHFRKGSFKTVDFSSPEKLKKTKRYIVFRHLLSTLSNQLIYLK